MDTELLKTFLEVHRCRHFGKAAENLYLTQSAVSFRIRQLESQLGVALFTRYRNNIQLTDAGERLLPHAEAMLLSLQRARQEMALSYQQRLQLALAASANIWDPFLQPRLPMLYQQLDNLTLRADVAAPDTLVRSLLERRLDLALLFDPPKVEELQVNELAALELTLVASRPDLTLAEALNGAYAKVDWGTLFNLQHAKLLKEQSPPILHTGNARIALTFIVEHGGAAYLPTELAAPALASERLFTVAEAPQLRREIYAASLKEAEQSALIEQICQLLSSPDDSVL